MTSPESLSPDLRHNHVFLGVGHETNERKTWGVIVLCSAMMVIEIVGGSVFGSLALVADGLHMSTHAGAMLIAAVAYTYARKHANDGRFVFGTGKLGDLAGYTSAIILAMIALLIGYEAVVRLLSPVPIHFREAIPIAVVGLLVNIVSAWLLSGDHHGHEHGHAHHGHAAAANDVHTVASPTGPLHVSIFEDGVLPVFRIDADGATRAALVEHTASVEVTTVRPGGGREVFRFRETTAGLESTTSIPEPHAFEAILALPTGKQSMSFEEHAHDHVPGARDHNIQAAYVHVLADAAVSVLAIIGLVLARAFGWLWMDPLAGVVGALVIANWAYGLVRDTGAILMDVELGSSPKQKVQAAVEAVGDRLVDLHVWRLGPGHFGAVVSVVTAQREHSASYFHQLLRPLKGLSHLTVEVRLAS